MRVPNALRSLFGLRITPSARAICGLELRSLLRDPRTLLISVVLPVVLLPAILLAGNWADARRVEREDARVYRYAITGGDSLFAADLLGGITIRGDPDQAQGNGGPEGGLGAADPGGRARFRLVEVVDAHEALLADSIDIHVEALTAESWRRLAAADTTAPGPTGEFEGARAIRIRFHSSRTASREGAERLREHLFDRREERRDSILLDAGFPMPPNRLVTVDTANVASDQAVQGARLGRFLTLILLGLVLLGGSAVATDTLAGEKERGTLTTLLTSAATRTEIVSGKLLAIMAVGLGIAVIQVLNLWIYLGLGVIEASEGFAATVSPGVAVGLLFLFLPVVALTAGVLLLTSAHARSYKEAQLYLTPVLLGMALPALAPLLPDMSLRSAIVLVPIANLSIAARDILVGQVDLLGIASAWFVTTAAAGWVTGRSVRALHDENVITGDTSREEFLGGPDLFRRRVLLWLGVFWAAKFLLDANLPFQDIRMMALVSVGLVFLAFPLVVIRRFQLDPVEALALRLPRPGVWAGVALGAPAGLIVAGTVFRLMDFVLPVPTELLENFGQALLPEGIPLWQLVVLLSVIPGITEELTFRGVLLHGLRRRFGPVGLALVVGLIFGFFHFQIFRIPATAALGVALAAVTLLTGSIFPAIVWHIVHNALAVYLGSTGVDFGGQGMIWEVGALIVLVVAFRIIWTNRTPYPDVGRPRRP